MAHKRELNFKIRITDNLFSAYSETSVQFTLQTCLPTCQVSLHNQTELCCCFILCKKKKPCILPLLLNIGKEMPRLTENVLLTFVCQIPNAQAKKKKKMQCKANFTILVCWHLFIKKNKIKAGTTSKRTKRTRKTNTLNPKIAFYWQLKKRKRETEKETTTAVSKNRQRATDSSSSLRALPLQLRASALRSAAVWQQVV